MLEPVEIGPKEKKRRRKRKLIVDEDKILATDVIKTQLADTSDIVKPATLAPPTKQRMKHKHSSRVESLFSQPSIELFATSILESVLENLNNNSTDEEPRTPESTEKLDDQMDIDEPELIRGAEESSVFETSKLSSVSFAKDAEAEKETGSEEHSLEEEQRPFEEDPLPDMEGNEDLLENGPDTDVQASQSTEQQLSMETDEQFESRRWTKRTQQVLHTLKRDFKKKNTVDFDTLCVKTNRKQVAYKFYSCLLLSREGTVEVQQKAPFGSLQIRKGPRYEEVC